MPEDYAADRPLFGGAISSTFPLRFQDVSNIRQVPDHQEVFVNPARDESLIFELLDLKLDVADTGSATWFLQDLATEQEAEGTMLIEQSGVIEADGLCFRNIPAVITSAVGRMPNFLQSLFAVPPQLGIIANADPQLPSISKQSSLLQPEDFHQQSKTKKQISSTAISKEHQGREAQNIVRVYLANLRLKEVGTDVLITAYEPVVINPLSESASTVGAGLAVPAIQSGCMPMSEVFKLALSSFKVNDWSLFGAA